MPLSMEPAAATTPDIVAIPVATHDPINAQILAVSEDKFKGFSPTR